MALVSDLPIIERMTKWGSRVEERLQILQTPCDSLRTILAYEATSVKPHVSQSSTKSCLSLKKKILHSHYKLSLIADSALDFLIELHILAAALSKGAISGASGPMIVSMIFPVTKYGSVQKAV